MSVKSVIVYTAFYLKWMCAKKRDSTEELHAAVCSIWSYQGCDLYLFYVSICLLSLLMLVGQLHHTEKCAVPMQDCSAK
jgi:hypothetical protein